MTRLGSRRGLGVRERFGRGRVVAVLGALFLVSQTAIAVITAPIGPARFLALQTTVSYARWVERFDGLAQDDLIGVYRQHFVVDLVAHPIIYAAALVALLAWLFRRTDQPASRDRWLIAPVVAAGLDVVENVIHLTYLGQPDRVGPGLVAVSGVASLTKWAIVGTCVVAAAVLGARPVRS